MDGCIAFFQGFGLMLLCTAIGAVALWIIAVIAVAIHMLHRGLGDRR